ncbi:MAG: hypothetical protein AAF957_18820 [Planctomycetota bacterium]
MDDEDEVPDGVEADPGGAGFEPGHDPEPQPFVGWRSLLPAAVLGLLSTVSYRQEGLEISGGATLAALAVLVLVWPIVRQVGVRGGSFELFGLKTQVARLERRTESDLVLKVEELRADLEDLRASMALGDGALETRAEVSEPGADDASVATFYEVVDRYRSNARSSEWRQRVNADRMLLSSSFRLPAARLEALLDANPDDRETKMATAVALGRASRGEGDAAAGLLDRLLRDGSQRVVYRAARSTQRLAERRETSAAARETLADGVTWALRGKVPSGVQTALAEALGELRPRST